MSSNHIQGQLCTATPISFFCSASDFIFPIAFVSRHGYFNICSSFIYIYIYICIYIYKLYIFHIYIYIYITYIYIYLYIYIYYIYFIYIYIYILHIYIYIYIYIYITDITDIPCSSSLDLDPFVML